MFFDDDDDDMRIVFLFRMSVFEWYAVCTKFKAAFSKELFKIDFRELCQST